MLKSKSLRGLAKKILDGYQLRRGSRQLVGRRHDIASVSVDEGEVLGNQQTPAALFDAEEERQKSLIPRAEKIEVQYEGTPKPCLLVMNKHISTPYNCAMHIGDHFILNAAVALVNGEVWDMHRPLEDSCSLKFVTFLDRQPLVANVAYWRSCSFLLGAVLQTSFKPQHTLTLHSWPKINISGGSFVYDIELVLAGGAGSWTPRATELLSLSRQVHRMKSHDLHFKTLLVSPSVAKAMFSHNKFKLQQIDSISSSSSYSMRKNIGELNNLSGREERIDESGSLGDESGSLGDERGLRGDGRGLNEEGRGSVEDERGVSVDVRSAHSKIRVYKLGDHVDISVGPLIQGVQQIGLFEVTAVHLLSPQHNLYRVQGLSIPHTLQLHHWTWRQLAGRAALLNTAAIPRLSETEI